VCIGSRDSYVQNLGGGSLCRQKLTFVSPYPPYLFCLFITCYYFAPRYNRPMATKKVLFPCLGDRRVFQDHHVRKG
jgi:hypothetical protein